MDYILHMRFTGRFLLCLCLSVTPAAAEAPGASVDEGMSLLEQGARIIMRSLLDDMEPVMKDLKDGMGEAMAEMGPALRALLAKIDDIRNFHPPEVLPNGDIILRRKSPAELMQPEPGAEIEL